ncbi:DUF7346 family protein [Salinirarus marinus]|uniref:DUF7346 family protein n=1 Tax=Salinirarus marinus TaxID=3068310 RepID=UPI003C6C583A
MPTVRDDAGNRYILLERSAESSRVRDPATGEERSLANDRLAFADDAALDVAASAVDDPIRRAVTAVHTDRALGLLLELVDRGPTSVRELLDAYDLCESDLHGLLTEFRAAGLVTECRVYGERGYEPTDVATVAVDRLR